MRLTPSKMSLFLSIGRKFPTPIRRTLLKYYLYFQSKISKVKENRKLSDWPSILHSSKKSLGESVQFDIHTITQKFALKIDSVCHIGAHKGQEISDYLNLGISAAVLIEPVRENFLVLQDLASSIPNYRAINIAAGNHQGSIKINLASNDFQSSSILQPHLHLHEAPNVTFDHVIESKISTLDKIVSDSQPFDLIVIDVQGYELRVLEGAIRTLRSCNYIFIEVNRAETYKGCAKIRDIDNFLLTHGFRRVLTKWWSSWGDAFYVRTTLLPLYLSAK
jgi:FkbM family methyltransferase